jgi:hypothetical protein
MQARLDRMPDGMIRSDPVGGFPDNAVRLDQDGRRPAQDQLRGLPRVDWSFTFAAAAYNLVRAPKLIAAAT